jgi:hypothetical protein
LISKNKGALAANRNNVSEKLIDYQVGWKQMARAFNVIIERDAEGYYVASVPELSGCHTQAKSLDTLIKRIREAIQLCLQIGE